MKKFILISIITLIFVVASGLLYINYIFLPNVVLPHIIKTIQENTPFILKISKIHYLPFKGVTIYNPKLIHPLQTVKFEYIRLKLSKLASLQKRSINVNIKSLLTTPFYIRINGKLEYHPTQKFINADITTENLNLTNLNFYPVFPLKINSGVLIQPEFNIYLNYKMDSFSFSGKLKFGNLLVESFENRFEGNLNVDLNSTGKLSDIKNAKYTVLIHPEANLKLALLPYNLSEISGLIKLEKDNLNFTNIKLNYNNYDFILNANIKNFNRPQGLLTLSSDKLDLNLNTELKLLNKDLHIKTLKATIKESRALVKGKLEDITNPNLNLIGNLYINIEDFREFLPELAKLNLAGKFNTAFNITGYIKELKSIKLEARSSSELIKINDFKINEISCKVSMENGKITIFPILAKSYEGKISMELIADITNRHLFFSLNSIIKGLNLELMREDIRIGEGTTGFGFVSLYLEGYGRKLDTIKGRGRLEIIDGKLLNFPILQGLSGILDLPGLEKIIFNTASGDFKIANKKLHTSNFKLMSDTINIHLAGNLSFKGDLDFIARAQIEEQDLENLSSVERMLQILLRKTGFLVDKIKIKGNLTKPEYTFISTIPAEIFEGIFN